MKTVIKKFAGDLRVRVAYGTVFFLLITSYLLTLYANSELLKEARVVSVALTVLMAIFAYVTYNNENRARRIADRRAAEYQQQLQDRIGELDKANKELIQMRSVEKLAASGRIARSIAHEVRNPLTNINLAVEQLQVDLEGSESKNSGEMLGMISRNSDRINLLITDLLNSTKFADLRYQRIGLHQLLDEMLDQAKDQIEHNNVSVIRTYTEEPCEISVDVKRMTIALLNIVVNALEAMEAGKGVLEIRTSTGNHKCVVHIKDNGPGIDEDSLSKVFEPYFTSKPHGTGLGLTNTQNIVLNHNGVISLESARGAGTTFMIQLERA